MLVCGCPASKGGILRARRRFLASALVSGRKNHDVYTCLCIHVHLFLVVAFRDARFLSGLYGRFSYIVSRAFAPLTIPTTTDTTRPHQDFTEIQDPHRTMVHIRSYQGPDGIVRHTKQRHCSNCFREAGMQKCRIVQNLRHEVKAVEQEMALRRRWCDFRGPARSTARSRPG